MRAPAAVVSNGFNQFHLRNAAVELARSEQLSLYLTGAYLTSNADLLFGLHARRKLARLRARAHPELSAALVHSLWWPEALDQLASYFSSSPAELLLRSAAMKLYGAAAGRALAHHRRPYRFYHYRAGFGQASLTVAQRKKAILLCDHSLVHPNAMPSLINPGAAFGSSHGRQGHNALDRIIVSDLNRADHVVVNSDFVRETFIAEGWDLSRVHTLMWGIDQDFLDLVGGSRPRRAPRTHLRLLFAGQFGQRKGADVLLEALRQVANVPWELVISGPIEKSYHLKLRSATSDDRVVYAGNLTRPELAAQMLKADCFVFPTLAEGSARVVFEALAAGCVVLTTPNAGSIVREGVHGRLLQPKDPGSLAVAIHDLWSRRESLDEMSAYNWEVVRRQYTQVQYGESLRALYARLDSERC